MTDVSTPPIGRSAPTTPQPRPGLSAITPYKGGAGRVAGRSNAVKLSSNENALGASPAAIAAARASTHNLALYPDGAAQDLRDALGVRYGLDPHQIVCGAGSDEILQFVSRAYAGPGDEIVFTEHAFLVYRLAAQQVGATPVAAPERALTADVDALLARVSPRTRLMMLANPNNPTGTYLPASEVRRLHAGLPSDVLLVLDGAYAEMVTAADYEDGLALAAEAENVLATRTFSKVYGLAALRLGWAFGARALIDTLNRVRGPFNVTTTALEAGRAALADDAFLARSIAHTTQEREILATAARDLGILATESVGNFILLRFPDTPGRTAQDADTFLQSHGFILRGMAAYGLPDCLRLSVGSSDANKGVIAVLRAFFQG